jgi:hypothetical protein
MNKHPYCERYKLKNKEIRLPTLTHSTDLGWIIPLSAETLSEESIGTSAWALRDHEPSRQTYYMRNLKRRV